MAVSRLSQTSLQNAFQKYNNVWDGRSAIGNMEAIGSYIVPSSGPTTVSFTSIPQTYTHLQLRCFARGTVAQTEMQTFLQFNSNADNNYSYHGMRGDGVSTYSFSGGANVASISGVTRFSAANATSGIYGVGITDIFDYTNTSKFKTVRSAGGSDINNATSGQIYITSGNWRSTSAITSILIGINDGGNFVQYSSFTLYGIK